MTEPKHNVVSGISSPFDGAIRLVARIIENRPNLDGGLCTGNPVGRIDLVDAAQEKNREGREAAVKLRAMCGHCPVRERCPDRADMTRSPKLHARLGRRCPRYHLVDGANADSRGECKACSRARNWGARRGWPASDPRVTERAAAAYRELMGHQPEREVS